MGLTSDRLAAELLPERTVLSTIVTPPGGGWGHRQRRRPGHHVHVLDDDHLPGAGRG